VVTVVTTVGDVGGVGTAIDGNCGGPVPTGMMPIDGRTLGPVLLSDRALAPARAVAAGDRCPTSGRARLSYWRAAEVFAEASGGKTLYQLCHSAIPHLAEAGGTATLLMAKSRHASPWTLQRYARPSVDAVAQVPADNDSSHRRYKASPI